MINILNKNKYHVLMTGHNQFSIYKKWWFILIDTGYYYSNPDDAYKNTLELNYP